VINLYINYVYSIHNQNSPKRPKMTEKSLKSFTITKRIAKHGNQAIIILPALLKEDLKPKTIVKVTIDILKEPENV